MKSDYGRSLIENLYASLIGLIWPYLFLNSVQYSDLFEKFDMYGIAAVAYGFFFICDDYYCSKKALAEPGLNQASWRAGARYWLDLLTLVCFFGFSLSAFKSPYLIYILALAIFLGLIWCKLLRADYDSNPLLIDSPSASYTRHIERQQDLHLYCIILFILSGIAGNVFALVSEDSDRIFLAKSSLSGDLLQLAVDSKLLFLLWIMLIFQWALRSFSALLYGVEMKSALTFFNFCNGKVVREPVRKHCLQLGRWFKNMRWYMLLPQVAVFGLFNTETRAVLIASIVGIWCLWEFVTGNGLAYEASVAASAGRSSNDPNAVKSVIRWAKELNLKSFEKDDKYEK